MWEALNLLHTFPKCSHISRRPAILRKTLGFKLDFWKVFKSFPARVASAVYPAKAWFHFILPDIRIIVFKHPVGMGMWSETQRSHLPLLLQCSVVMKALQRSSSKPLSFREARNLETEEIRHQNQQELPLDHIHVPVTKPTATMPSSLSPESGLKR